MKVKARDLKPGDIIRFTDPNSPDAQIAGDLVTEDGEVSCIAVTYGDDGLPWNDEGMPFILGSPDDELEVVYRGRQYVHPGISTTDDGDDLSRLNEECQDYVRVNKLAMSPIVRDLMERLNKLVSPDAEPYCSHPDCIDPRDPHISHGDH